MKKNLFSILFLFLFVLACGGTKVEEAPPPPEASESGCAFERGSPLPEALSGKFELQEVETWEEGNLTEEEAVTPEKTILLSLAAVDGTTEIQVDNTLTTDDPTRVRGRVSLEGESNLAVAVDESTVPFIFAGATYCLGFAQEADAFTVIFEMTSDKSLHYRFVRSAD